ncbi:hypothetical protein [Bradyrhizobium sp. 195]|uniref:hypothetical protein n=1 Tax=Bradyrhizobium sp. 195 TaxID=2782662 RepID=UPI002000EA83|nr:hypothetical protein [Bradyrhizobium sp. 195]UPK28167.1 hypothetical protein IVB26_06420 [Bradyrhizobium sp. 195]
MKGIVNPLRVSRCLQIHEDVAARKGIRFFIGFDFHEYNLITRTTPAKERTNPNFRSDRSRVEAGEGYWIIGVDKNNDVAGLEAARLYRLSHSNFAEHLESLKAFYADPTRHAHPQDRCICTAPTAKKMTGKVAYHGDLWVRRDLRGQGIRKIITRITHGVSFAMWAPDFLCALVARSTLDKGVDDMPHHEAGGAVLQLVDEDIVEDNWLSWLTGEELRSRFDGQDSTELLVVPSFSPAGLDPT